LSILVTAGPITADAATAKVVGIKKSITVSASATNKVTGLSKAEKKIVKVTKKGKKFTIKGLKAGKATFKIGKKSYIVKVGATTVKAAKTKLTLTKGKAATLKFTTKSGNGDTLTFKASNKNVTLAKKSAKIAKSAASVKATAKKAGKTTITATSKATGKKATVTVTVKNATTPATATPETSNTPVATATGSATNTPEATATATATASGSATNTPDVTATPVATATGTATATPVATGSATNTPEATEVPTEAPTKAPEVVTGGTITVSGAAVTTDAAVKVVSGTTVVYEGTVAGLTAKKLDAGTYVVTVSKKGYEEATTSAVVVDKENTIVTVELEKILAVTESKAVGAKKLQVKFNKDITAPDEADITVLKETTKMNISSIEWTAKDTVVITLSSNLDTADYTVNVTKLDGKEFTQTIKAEKAKVDSIKILSENAVLTSGTQGNVKIAYKVYNQYQEDITSSTTLSATSNGGSGTPVTATNGEFVTQGSSFNTTTNKTFTITLVHPTTGVNASATLTVSSAATANDVKIVGIYNANGKELDETETNEVFYLEVEVLDQYGNKMDASSSAAKTGLILSETNTTIVDLDDTTNTPNIVKLPGTTDRYGIKLDVKKAGTSDVLLISKTSGKQASYSITVAEGTRAYSVSFGAPEYAIAKEDVLIPLNVADKNGAEITDLTLLNDAAKGIDIESGSTATSLVKGNDGKIYVKIASNASTKGFVTLTAQCKTSYKTDTLTLEIKDAAYPKTIIGLNGDFATSGLNGATMGYNDVIVEDQYGRTLSKDKNADVFATMFDEDSATTAGYKIKAEDTDNNSGVVSVNGYLTKYASASGVTLSSTANGSETIKLTIYKYENTQWKPVNGTEFEFSYTMTDGTEYVNYVSDDLPTVYAKENTALDANYTPEIKVYGVLKNGAKIKLTLGQDYQLSSDDNTFSVLIANGLSGDTPIATGGYGVDENGIKNTTKTFNYDITINNTGDVIGKKITFSSVLPKGQSFKLATGTKTDIVNGDVLGNTAYGLAQLLKDIEGVSLTGNTSSKLFVVDQYGVETPLIDNASGNNVKFTDSDTTSMGLKLTFSKVSGTTTFAQNGTATAQITNASAGSVVKVTLTAGNASQVFTITFQNGIDTIAPTLTSLTATNKSTEGFTVAGVSEDCKIANNTSTANTPTVNGETLDGTAKNLRKGSNIVFGCTAATETTETIKFTLTDAAGNATSYTATSGTNNNTWTIAAD